jgi:ribosomal protein S18 acetylase RimI-like enzyme
MLLRPAQPGDEAGLAALFSALVAAGEDRLFHPHPLTRAAARTVCGHRATASAAAHDEYHLAIAEPPIGGRPSRPPQVVGYGMLRGWVEGFAVPSLGIAVHPGHRGRGVARGLVAHLHRVAAARGAATVRLKVYRHNAAAVRLYECLGYELRPLNTEELVGRIAVMETTAA